MKYLLIVASALAFSSPAFAKGFADIKRAVRANDLRLLNVEDVAPEITLEQAQADLLRIIERCEAANTTTEILVAQDALISFKYSLPLDKKFDNIVELSIETNRRLMEKFKTK